MKASSAVVRSRYAAHLGSSSAMDSGATIGFGGAIGSDAPRPEESCGWLLRNVKDDTAVISMSVVTMIEPRLTAINWVFNVVKMSASMSRQRQVVRGSLPPCTRDI
jgi:hypothetical protein